MAPFEPVDPKVDLPALERRVLEWWREADVFARQLDQRTDGPLWVFYEGPPTANGRPGVHHVEARTFKDVFPRYKSMTGHHVPRKAGWDCHGLPVELEVEKEIGTRSKRDIEAFGIAEFNRLCRESVQRYVGEFERLTERIGFWIDMPDAYWTMSPDYIESVWWSLKQLHARGLLVEDDRIATYCPRCGTPLSDAEVAMGYAEVEDPSVVIEFRILEAADPSFVGASLLGWTTTPWTLVSNAGVAVAEDAPYVIVEHDGRRAILADARREAVLPDAPVVGGPVPGAALVGARYEPLYPNVEGAHRVVATDFVSLDDGTGVVHIAPAFGAEDLEVGRREGWPLFRPLDNEGRFTDEAPSFVRGVYFKDADDAITEDLRSRGLLIRAGTLVHTYPLCWRCGTPLIYFARTSWYIRTTAVKDRLLAVNEEVNWFPEHIKHGRYGDWLENNVDWALSRERYWGTPLPIWRCANRHDTAIGSLAELSERSGRDVSGLDPHRPQIDEVTFACPECGETAVRVPEVIDTWYDSGAMPFAQWGYQPELGRGVDVFRERFPADFISEAIDQTRGWFYTLMAEGVLHFDSIVYRNVVCLGLIMGEDGRRMSTSLGTAIDPFDVLDRQGADALRWYLLTNGSPWAARRVGMSLLDDVVRQFLLTLWNVYSFFVTYANASAFDPSEGDAVAPAERPILDRWILSQLARTVGEARDGLEAYDATAAGRRIAAFVDDLSNWYVRRSRRRFWDPGGTGGEDSRAAFHTLHECLVTLAGLLAPFTPFVAEELWRNLAAGRDGRPDSVHLSDYPAPDPSTVDEQLDEAMSAARTIVELGRRIRTETKVRVRQPLLEAVVHLPGDREALRPLLDLVAEELNVKDVQFAESVERFGRWRAKPNFRSLGPKLGPRVKELSELLRDDDGSLAAVLASGRPAELDLPSGRVTIEPADVDLVQETLEGWGVASDGGATVALELELTAELRREGLAREIVRVVQDARKAAGLDVGDRIVLGFAVEGDLAAALEAHADDVAAETLATELRRDPIEGAPYRDEVSIDGSPLTVTLRRS
ncbi:MAG TPA: isoleucine--tRNA ligase [Actinomycetota bacterium]|nr:isoleucine--tRNA ligase [Actinomycetota bacterium]